jgi:hypothetical protein
LYPLSSFDELAPNLDLLINPAMSISQTRKDTRKSIGAGSNVTAPQKATDAAHGENSEQTESPSSSRSSSFRNNLLGRIGIFIVFPVCVGTLGVLASVISNKTPNIERDFVTPFLLALAFVIIIGFQTSGFRQTNAQPLVQWPKVKRVKKIVHRKMPKRAPIKED